MMRVIPITDRRLLEAFLRRDTIRHLFEIGDLDDRYWGDTTWYGGESSGELRQVALIYRRPRTPVLMLYGDEPRHEARTFVRLLSPGLPDRMYAHLEEDLLPLMGERFRVANLRAQIKMGLDTLTRLAANDTAPVAPLLPADVAAVEHLYAEAYPDTHVSSEMLSTGRWRGIWEGSCLVSVAGLHVYSPTYRVAALGGVTTHPSARNRGLGTLVSHALCEALIDDGVRDIGLIVEAENTGAIALYERLGLTRRHEFISCLLEDV